MDILFIVLIAVAALILFGAFRYVRTQRYLKTLTEDQWIEGYRKAQLIDVREPNEYERGHILGARNIPLSQMKQRLVEIRKDKPVYLYCQSGTRSVRAANMLRKKGYEDLNHLKGGFRKWNGKIKVKKKGY
ncbi:rhodanese-like domain-containing protein [Halalkalibacillus sediminis]|uniref:Rhodanese-like domain-containing protein n=1 Tax=Halalkalibacillus sediminis TaxID=2018042 RepID=A0A2I0QXD1_9BACI|nr:rhodanese-like domain-containing protein [Halalkalibacillus sediminis]PKR78974.1 rhodanese-like domain-containing protein [Halalkalibacillus sediminis]